MIFNFLKYIKPTWYYNLKPDTDHAYFHTETQLAAAGYVIETDLGYLSADAQKRDLAWRAFQSGFISKEKKPGMDVWKTIKLPVVDEYRFLKKNFSKFWVLYVLLVRLLTLKNPFREIASFFKTQKVQRDTFHKNSYPYSDYVTFESDLIKANPLVSVIIPTLNRYEYLKDVLNDLEQQTYKNFEVIVVDQTDDFREDFYKGWNLNLIHWHQEEKALWKARNEAIKSSNGNYVLMSEDDIRFSSDFIEMHVKALDYFNADVSCGVFFPEGNEIPKERSFFRYSEQFATGNTFLKKAVFKKTGLYDRQFEKQRMGDGEFGLRAYLHGFKLIANPLAFCEDVKAPVGGLRQNGGAWDSWRPKKLLAPRPVPSVLYFSRTYFGDRNSLRMLLPALLPSVIPYRFKQNRMLKLFSILLFPVLLPLVGVQVFLSWQMSSKKIKEGSKIERL